MVGVAPIEGDFWRSGGGGGFITRTPFLSDELRALGSARLRLILPVSAGME